MAETKLALDTAPGQEKDRGAVFCLTSASACGTHRPMWKGKSLFFKRRLAAVLAVRGMGQRELAEMCKVTPRTVRNWLSGKAPSSTVFALISTKWGEDTFNYLVGETNTMPEPTQTNELPWYRDWKQIGRAHV